MTPQLIETDGRSRVVLPGHPDERFVMQEQEDGSVLLTPARVLSEAQYEYDTTPELRELLELAMSQESVRRPRRKRRGGRAA